MPGSRIFADPSDTATIGASLQIVRTAVGASGVAVSYNANNGDAPFEFTLADAGLSAAEKTAVQTIHQAAIRLMRASRNYT